MVVSFRQKTTTILTSIALDMEVTIQSHNPDSLFFTGVWHDRFFAHRASGSKFLVKVFNAVDEATRIYSEWNSIQAAVTHHTGKTVRMIGFPCGTKNPLHDGLGTYTALLQGANIAGLAVGFLLHCIEGLPSEFVVTVDAGKAIHMEDLIHGSASCTFPNYILPTASTATKIFISRWILHVKQHFFGQLFKLIFRVE